MSTDRIIARIMESEGGYVDHPADRGGPTNHGITMATLTNWRGQPVTVDDVKALSENEARSIYHDRYIVAPGYLALPEPLRMVVVDWAVLSGPVRATKGLQKAVGASQDGIIGAETLKAMHGMSAINMAVRVCAEQARQLGRIITADSSQAVFAAGWMNRLADKLEEATA